MVQFLALLTLLLIPSSRSLAVDLYGFYGQETIEHNSLFSTSEGSGRVQGCRLLVYPGAQNFLGIGGYYASASYKLAISQDVEGVNLSGTGTYTSDSFGPALQVTAPISTLTFYFGFSYITGSAKYNMEKSSTFESASGDEVDSRLQSQVAMSTHGLSTYGGIRSRGTVGFFAEYSQSFQSLEIRSLNVSSGNYINGKRESRDAEQESYNDTFDDLVGETFHFDAFTITGGIVLTY